MLNPNLVYTQSGKEELVVELNKLTETELKEVAKFYTPDRTRKAYKSRESLMQHIIIKTENNPMNNWDIWKYEA